MGVKKPKTETAAPAKAPTDDLAQIMSEIESLQQEMTAPEPVQAAQPAPSLKLVQTETTAAEETPIEASTEEDALSEFRADSGEVSMEETLADLKDETEGSGNSLLDQAIEGTSEVTEEVVAEETIEEPVAEEIVEEAVAEEPVEEPVEEVVETVATESEETPVEEIYEHEEEVAMSKEKKTEYGAGEGCLTMTLQGNMTLKLNYECDGQEVTVGFSDGCLQVQLADGTEFKIPVARTNVRKIGRAA